MHPIRRAAALAVATATVAALAACSPTPAEPVATVPAPTATPASTPTPTTDPTSYESGREAWEAAAAEASPGPVELLDTTPITADAYVARFSDTSGQPYGTEGIDDVNAEYREAAQVFPLALPDGYAFPAEARFMGRSLPDGWQRGDGVAEAFSFWRQATATAAFNDHLRGDQQAAEVHLDALAAGYDSPVRAMFVADPDLAYLEQTVAPAYEGNFDRIYLDDAQRFLGWDGYAAVSAHAGDWEYLGTEGYAMQAP
ncbi:MAG: hypothetical protein ACQEWM_07350 [Actinomycetota bacterium]